MKDALILKNNLKALRKEKNLSQQELAEMVAQHDQLHRDRAVLPHGQAGAGAVHRAG